MAEESSSSPSPQAPPPPPPLQYVEVNCNSSGKTRRFATGTDAGFAVAVINRKGAVPVASHIEAMKDGEEPIAFGPNSILSNFGEGWKLHTVTFSDLVSSEEERKEHVRRMVMQTPGIVSGVPGSEGFKPISLVDINFQGACSRVCHDEDANLWEQSWIQKLGGCFIGVQCGHHSKDLHAQKL
ncbi:uncharacterized protein LOC133307385 [Gastrolobium bilobum]|uniref:uncharacterized protein LOC133307385 n=1 Tax=Gastrolobium bilobum TaxID=150636 RepID=UPI002AB09BD8|nr:uncharacterized protein LOC133307385 [Gastrolobium bilobum]